MADQSGRRIAVGLAKETTRGTVATPTYWLPQMVIDFHNKIKLTNDEAAYGVLNKVAQSALVEQWADGKIEGNVGDKSFGLILLAAFGNSSSVLHAGETVVYDTTFTQNQTNTAQSLTVTRKDTNSDYNYARAMLKTLEIHVVVGSFVTYTSEWVSLKGVTGTDTVSYTLENKFKPKYATAKIANNVAGLGAATAIPLKEMKLKVTRTINPYFVFGSNDPGEIFNEDFMVTGDMTLRYTDQTYENLFYNNTEQAVLLDLKNTDVTIGATTNPELKFTLPKIVLNDWKPDQNKDKITEQTLTLQGEYDLASSSELQAVLTNLVASY